MATKDYRGREITITVKGSGSADAGTDRRGSNRPSKKKKPFLHRRRTAKEGIRFFDLGYRRSSPVGPFADIGYSKLHPAVFQEQPEPYQEYIAELEADIFSVDLAEFETRFHEITRSNGDRYPIRFALEDGSGIWTDEDSELWSDDGLVLSGSNINGLIDFIPAFGNSFGGPSPRGKAGRFTNQIQLRTFPDEWKITSVRDFAAPEVSSFRFTGSESVFFMPRVTNTRGDSSTTGGSSGRILNWVIYIWPRETRFDPSSFAFDFPFSGGAITATSTLSEYNQRIAEINYFKTFPQARAFDFDAGTGILTPVPLSGFPDPTHAAFPIPAGNFRVGFYDGGGAFSGGLTAAVKRGSEWFYIWKT